MASMGPSRLPTTSSRLRRVRPRLSGRTLVESALLFSAVGVFLAVFVPAFFRAIHVSRLDEPPRVLQAIAERAQRYYELEHPGCLPPAAGPFPETPSARRVPIDWNDAPEEQSAWQVLRPSEQDELAYSYSFFPQAAGCEISVEPGVPLFSVVAEGDLDDDGERSRFVLEIGPLPEDAIEGRPGELGQLGPMRISHRVE